MGFRFSRRIKVLPGVSINLSKSGASVSVGPRGAKVTVGPRGVTQTVGCTERGFTTPRPLAAERRVKHRCCQMLLRPLHLPPKNG